MPEQRLTLDEWATICTIHQEPDYQFVGSELRRARRMAREKLLKERIDKRFTVTRTGERRYALGVSN